MKKTIILLMVWCWIMVFSSSICAGDSILVLQSVITNQTSENELFEKPYNLAVTNDGYILVVDQKYILQKFTIDGTKVDWAAEFGQLEAPVKFVTVTVTGDGVIFLTHKNKRIYTFSPDGKLENNRKYDEFSWLDSITYNAQDNLIYLADNSTIHVLSKTGELQDSFKDANLWQPLGIAFSPKGYLYVADTNHQEVKVFTPWGESILSFGSPTTTQGPGQLEVPFGIAIDQNSRIYVSNSSRQTDAINSIEIYAEDGRLLEHYPLLLPSTALPVMPAGIAIAGNQLFVADMANSAIVIFQITDIAPDADE